MKPETDKPFQLVSFRHLASLLGRDYKTIKRIANKAGRYYKPFDKEKLGSTKQRHIDNPTGELKFLQKQILKNILSKVPLPDTIFGGVPKRSVKQNAQVHTKQLSVIAIDIRDCFPNTDNLKVYKAYIQIGCSPSIAATLTKLTTYQHRLPQGSPTSSVLCNLCLLPMHNEILQITQALDVKFTIYVDDITISGKNAPSVIGAVIKIIHKHGYGIRRNKICRMRSYQQQKVNGILVNSKVSISRMDQKKLCKEILSVAKTEVVTTHEIRSIRGKISYIKSISIPASIFIEKLAGSLLPKRTINLQAPKKENRTHCTHTKHHKQKKLKHSISG